MAKLTVEELVNKYNQMNAFENEAYSNGCKYVAGIDEAGRGPLAGPVVVAACILDPLNPILGLDDSKKLSEKKREQLFIEIKEKALSYVVIRKEADVIDSINILEATKQAMRDCANSLEIKPDMLLIDAVKLDGVDIPVNPIIKGDSKSNSIAAASILAKVTRDHIMVDYDKEYPGYNFGKHKGYGTKDHYASIRELGMCPIHRRTFLKVIH